MIHSAPLTNLDIWMFLLVCVSDQNAGAGQSAPRQHDVQLHQHLPDRRHQGAVEGGCCLTIGQLLDSFFTCQKFQNVPVFLRINVEMKTRKKPLFTDVICKHSYSIPSLSLLQRFLPILLQSVPQRIDSWVSVFSLVRPPKHLAGNLESSICWSR